nr:MAG TPA: hypothetical protein [Caudoviricetes sp.]
MLNLTHRGALPSYVTVVAYNDFLWLPILPVASCWLPVYI